MRRTMKTVPTGTTRRRLAMPLVVSLLAIVAVADRADARRFGDWQSPVAVSAVNGPATEGCPIESPDGLSLYLMSTRGEGGDQDIWVATRDASGDSFGEPEMLPAPVNSDANDFCPTPLRGNWLLFVSNRGGTDAYGTAACGGGDIYVTRRSPVTGEWAAPRNLGCTSNAGPNGPGTEFGPTLLETDAGRLLLFSSGGDLGSNTQDIYASREQDEWSFGAREAVAALNSERDDIMPNISKDGREIVFASNRLDGRGAFDIWTSTRASVLDSWTAPTNVAIVNSPGPETRPSLSWEGSRLYFGRSGEIYVSSR